MNLREDSAVRDDVQEVRRSAQRWKAQAERLSARLQALAARRDAELREAGEAAAAAQTWRHAMPSHLAVKSRFPYRLRTFRARTQLVSPADREARLMAASDAYRERLDAGASSLERDARREQLEGLTIWVPARTKSTKVLRLPYHGIMLTRELAPGGVMLDLGAHVGRMSIPRVILGDATAAYCAEPDPLNYACLAANVIDNALRGVVLPDQTAIGDVNGTVRLVRAGAPSGFYVNQATTGADSVVVPCSTLDSWVARLGIDLEAVTFIKVDVEGFELRVLRGGPQVLACRHIAWQMEMNPARLRGAGDDLPALYSALRDAFTHFIDLNRRVSGERVRKIEELDSALAYIDPGGKTDILLFAAS